MVQSLFHVAEYYDESFKNPFSVLSKLCLGHFPHQHFWMLSALGVWKGRFCRAYLILKDHSKYIDRCDVPFLQTKSTLLFSEPWRFNFSNVFICTIY